MNQHFVKEKHLHFIRDHSRGSKYYQEIVQEELGYPPNITTKFYNFIKSHVLSASLWTARFPHGTLDGTSVLPSWKKGRNEARGRKKTRACLANNALAYDNQHLQKECRNLYPVLHCIPASVEGSLSNITLTNHKSCKAKFSQ